MMELVRLVDLGLDSRENGHGLTQINLTLSAGDAFSICTDSAEHAHLLVKGIASLERPTTGRLFYKEMQVDLHDREALLAYKRNVGYVAADATLISKASVFDNLMLMRHYYDNSMAAKMPDSVRALCRFFGLENSLDFHPWQLEPEETRLFVIIRELAKDPAVLLIERPGDYLRNETLDMLKHILKHQTTKEQALVLFSAHQDFVEALCQKQITIVKGQVTTSDLPTCR
jgi:ABC-type lipoprotein export system ATPase subunit